MSVKWDYDATAALLRFGRKNSGPWEDGNIPDDGDTDMVISAPQVAADYAALESRHNALVEEVAWLCDIDDAWRVSCNRETDDAWVESQTSFGKARAEVDRLIANQGSDDCQGDG